MLSSGGALAADPESCKAVRFADVGWTDITATTATASVDPRGARLRADVQVLSVPVTYTSLKNKDIDVFLGNWMPTMEADIKPYLEDKSVETIVTNLEGAKYTLAVPQYTYDAGLKDFADIAKFKDKLDNKIYGIEAGNDGNRLILDMIAANKFGLEGFELVESSEAGMLSAVQKAAGAKEDVVFLGWEPHPMNANIEMAYLSGGDEVFGPNFGGATVHTNVRAGYVDRVPECRQVRHQPRLLARDGKRDHGRDPERRRRPEGRRHRLAEGQSGRGRRPGSPASPPSTAATRRRR